MKEKDNQDVESFLKEASQNQKQKRVEQVVAKKKGKYKYHCPKCKAELESRKNGCASCGYQGYIPMNEKEMKKIRWILFIILSIVFIITWIL